MALRCCGAAVLRCCGAAVLRCCGAVRLLGVARLQAVTVSPCCKGGGRLAGRGGRNLAESPVRNHIRDLERGASRGWRAKFYARQLAWARLALGHGRTARLDVIQPRARRVPVVGREARPAGGVGRHISCYPFAPISATGESRQTSYRSD